MKHTKKLSSFQRESILQEMANVQLDLLVIGGGVTGAGIALDAASRGLRVGLLEKQDFAAGTSSRSTKLIHGGLRYLKQGDIQLVREVGRERAILYRNAPHIVIPEKMILPIVEKGTYGKLATSIGLWVYDFLAGVEKAERRIMLCKRQTAEREPLLRTDILKGSGLYYEYRTDDARLTIEVIKTAAAHGAKCVNYAEADDLIYENGRLIGVAVTDLITGKTYQIYAKKIVNAAGPWVDRLREKDGSLKGKRLHLTKGVHLVVPHHRLPLKQSVYFDVAGGRMIFAIPRNQITYIGTTDTNYQGVLEHPEATQEDVNYLLKAVNDMFPTVHLTEEDIASSWAGLRPLIHEDGKSPSELSRKDETFHSPSGLITIAGGKLTGFRKMAERVVDLVMQQLSQEEGRELHPCVTDKIVLSGGNFPSPSAIPLFIKDQAERAAKFGVKEAQITDLVGKYGTNTEKIVTSLTDLSKEYAEPSSALIHAELLFTLQEEMVMNLSDFLVRRTGRLYFHRETLPEVIGLLMEKLADALNWTEEQKQKYRKMFEDDYTLAKRFM